MKKKLIFINLIIVFVFELIFLPTMSYALSWSNFFSDADRAIRQSDDVHINQNALQNASTSMFNMLVGIGAVLSVIIGGVLGIQFLLASAEDKAKIKETLMPYVFGCVIIFGAYGIWKLVVDMGQQLYG